MRNSSFSGSKGQPRKAERYGSRNIARGLEQRTILSFQKKPAERKLLVSSTRRNRKQNLTAIYQNSENFIKLQNISSKIVQKKVDENEYKAKEIEQYIDTLKEHMLSLVEKKAKIRKSEDELSKCTELNEQIEEVYGNYAVLSRETLEQKALENTAFEMYINASQDKEKALTDVHLSISHQKMKIKLLNETLNKHNREYELALSKSKKVVNLNVKEGYAACWVCGEDKGRICALQCL
eukprot:TRINITY_DN6964_c0_g2_i1.p1 TRINITY_DN6964_c0_g2~~TRINITY_DN6964_c0_g2_i1.p1  ORF type:complete len:237 (-),score=58.23 TRINITY_DN6964_c0_g2_i1:210-920(-)